MNYIDMISSVGFPIVCVFGLGFYVNKITAEFQQTIREMTLNHATETTELKEAINNLAIEIKSLKND